MLVLYTYIYICMDSTTYIYIHIYICRALRGNTPWWFWRWRRGWVERNGFPCEGLKPSCAYLCCMGVAWRLVKYNIQYWKMFGKYIGVTIYIYTYLYIYTYIYISRYTNFIWEHVCKMRFEEASLPGQQVLIAQWATCLGTTSNGDVCCLSPVEIDMQMFFSMLFFIYRKQIPVVFVSRNISLWLNFDLVYDTFEIISLYIMY